MIAIVSRVVLALIGASWALIAVTPLIGVSFDSASQPILISTLLVFIAVTIGLLLAARSEEGKQRMRQGPGLIQKRPLVVLGAGILSAAGGHALFVAGHAASASWVLNLSLLLVVSELAAILGGISLRPKA